MTARDFAYWLQGFFELTDESGNLLHTENKPLNPRQVAKIKRHLAMVFAHDIDPSMGDESHQAELNHLHKPSKPGDVIPRC